MIVINKREEQPGELEAWLQENEVEVQQKLASANTTGTKMWNEFTEKEDFPKDELRQALLEDQGYICCYCGFPVNNNGQECVIEHFKPKSKSEFKNLTFDYTNLFASCKGGSKNIVHIKQQDDTIDSIAAFYDIPQNYLFDRVGDFDSIPVNKPVIIKKVVGNEEQHCDCLKGSKELNIDLINPDNFPVFHFSHDGEVNCNEDDEGSKEDLRKLGLNSNFELSYLRHLHYEHSLDLFRTLRKNDPESFSHKFRLLKQKYYQKDQMLRHKAFFFIYKSIWGN